MPHSALGRLLRLRVRAGRHRAEGDPIIQTREMALAERSPRPNLRASQWGWDQFDTNPGRIYLASHASAESRQAARPSEPKAPRPRRFLLFLLARNCRVPALP